jgi:hypothetical protein
MVIDGIGIVQLEGIEAGAKLNQGPTFRKKIYIKYSNILGNLRTCRP